MRTETIIVFFLTSAFPEVQYAFKKYLANKRKFSVDKFLNGKEQNGLKHQWGSYSQQFHVLEDQPSTGSLRGAT